VKKQGCFDAATEARRADLVLTRAMLGDRDAEVSKAMGNLALNLAKSPRAEDVSEAQRLVNEAVALDEAHRKGPGRSNLVFSYMQQTNVAVRRMERGGDLATGAAAEAQGAFDAARPLIAALHGDASEAMSLWWNELGYFRDLQNRPVEAVAAYGTAYDMLKQLPDADPADLAVRAMNVGASALRTGLFEEALPRLEEAYALASEAYAVNPSAPSFLNKCGWLIFCHLVRDRAGIPGARSEAERLCALHGFDIAELERIAAKYPLNPPD